MCFSFECLYEFISSFNYSQAKCHQEKSAKIVKHQLNRNQTNWNETGTEPNETKRNKSTNRFSFKLQPRIRVCSVRYKWNANSDLELYFYVKSQICHWNMDNLDMHVIHPSNKQFICESIDNSYVKFAFVFALLAFLIETICRC